MFSARISKEHGVGLLTCGEGHHSLLLDSRESWFHAIQTGRPREAKCLCGSRTFEVSVEFLFREAGGDMRSAAADATCAQCRLTRELLRIDIKYSGTERLVARPLDPVDEPWIRPTWIELTGFWKDGDLAAVLHQAEAEHGATLQLDPIVSPLQTLRAAEVLARIQPGRHYRLWLSAGGAELPKDVLDCWKTEPVIGMPEPFRMLAGPGLLGDLQYFQYAESVVRNGEIHPQPTPFLHLARGLATFLQRRFVASRGRNAIDNPAEVERLGLGGPKRTTE